MTSKHRASMARPSLVARARSALATLLLLAFSCSIAVLFAELVVRMVRPQTVWYTSPGMYAPDGDEGYKLAPGYRGRSYNRTEFDHLVSVNALGVRGAEMGAKRDGVKRVLVLGDSFAFGVGVEDDETFPARLPALVATQERSPGQEMLGVETINSGIPGLGAPQQVRWLERHGLAMEPDAIVLAVFLGNDLQDATAEAVSWRIVDGQMVGKDKTPRWRHWLYFKSHLYALIKSAAPSGIQQRVRERLGLSEATSDRLSYGVLEVYAKPQSEVSRDGEVGTAKALDRLMTIADERNLPVAAMLIPEVAQASPERWRTVLAQLDADPAGYDALAPNRVFEKLLGARGIPVLDLTTSLSAAIDRGEQPYFERDRHWSASGHAIAAEELATFLTAQGWFSPPDRTTSEPVASPESATDS